MPRREAGVSRAIIVVALVFIAVVIFAATFNPAFRNKPDPIELGADSILVLDKPEMTMRVTVTPVSYQLSLPRRTQLDYIQVLRCVELSFYPDYIGPEWRQPRPMVGLDTLLNEQILRGIDHITIPIEGENRKEIRDDER